MERRVLLAILLAFLTLYVWQALFVKPQPKPSATPGASTAEKVPGPPPAAPSALPAAPPPSTEAAPRAASLTGETAERDVRVETADVVAVFTNRGARLKSWRLKHYLDQNRQPVELVVAGLPATQPLPFSLRVEDDGLTATLNNALYAVTGVPPSSAPIASPTDLTFEYEDTSGLHARKQFHLSPNSYLVEFRATTALGDRTLQPAIEWGPGLGDPDSTTGRYAVKPQGLMARGGERPERLTAAAVAKQSVFEDQFAYVGVDDHYFLSAAVGPGRAKIVFQAFAMPPPSGSTEPPRDLMAYAVDPARRDEPLRFYVGPKEIELLKALDPPLTKAINFGWWDFLIVPLLRALNGINGYIGNYGWSIIALTIIINLVMFPLRHKSVVSMRKMQEIQPEAKAIQDRYAKLKATDPAKQKMNQELMALYRERGVNPASGCIPMLLTFPVLFAFYSLLTTAIELRGAPFMLWIHDLSLPDPFYVLPILMGASQLWQQWIAPATGVDPAQRKMMMFMPLVFTFIFVAAPVGTVLYWLVSNLWAIGQQYVTNYLIGPPTVRAVRPPAERQLKRAGEGKT
jgi:YidC/Oxa1 family membrane protein insertase